MLSVIRSCARICNTLEVTQSARFEHMEPNNSDIRLNSILINFNTVEVRDLTGCSSTIAKMLVLTIVAKRWTGLISSYLN